MRHIAAMALLLLLAPAAQGAVYKCVEGNTIVFSEVPCGDNATVMQLPAQVSSDDERFEQRGRSTYEKNRRQSAPSRSSGSGGGSAFDAVKRHCADKWGNDYRMQMHCREQQGNAAKELNQFMDHHPEGTEERRIINRCANKWRESDFIDYRMTVHCTKQQMNAYEVLD